MRNALRSECPQSGRTEFVSFLNPPDTRARIKLLLAGTGTPKVKLIVCLFDCFLFFRCGDGDHLSLYLHLERGEVNERTPTNGRLCALPAKRSGRYGNNPVRYYSATSTLVLAFHTKPSGNGSPSINVPAKTAATKAPSNPSPSHVVIAADESISSSPPSVSGPYGFTGTFRFIRKSTSSLSFSFHPSGSTRLERLSIVRSHGNEKEKERRRADCTNEMPDDWTGNSSKSRSSSFPSRIMAAAAQRSHSTCNSNFLLFFFFVVS